MNLRYQRTPFSMYFICLFTTIFLLNFSCSKDSDILNQAVTNEEVSFIEQDSAVNNTNSEEEIVQPIETEQDQEDNSSTAKECVTSGGRANDTGLKTWCWENVQIPSGTLTGRDSFSNGQLALSIECSANQVVQEGNRLKFMLNPVSPSPMSWCNNDFNMRSEIRTMPWKVNQPLGTEEWLGWSYTFGDNYQIDSENTWSFFQMQQGIAGSPPHTLIVANSGVYGAQNGEVVLINLANKTKVDRTLTGVVPQAGTTLNVVVHVIHDLGSKGMLQVWINGNMVYDERVGTVHDWAPWGGNAKFGIYKWPWKNEEAVQSSINNGNSNLETFMGPLRILTRKPNDADYGRNSYEEVNPQ